MKSLQYKIVKFDFSGKKFLAIKMHFKKYFFFLKNAYKNDMKTIAIKRITKTPTTM